MRVSLKGILAKLPEALKTRVRSQPNAQVELTFPMAGVIPQLGQGRVQVTFGELRRAAPPGVIADATDQDNTAVDLPLAEILPQIPPNLLPRRSSQKKVEVPDEVAAVFNTGGRGSARIAPKETPKPQPSPAEPPPSTFRKPAAPIPAPIPGPKLSPPPTPTAPVPLQARATPATPPAAPIPVRPVDAGRGPVPTPAGRPSQAPSPKAAPAAPSPGRPPAAPAPTPQRAPSAPTAAGTLTIPVEAFIESWPDALKSLLAPHVKGQSLTMALPMGDVEKGLKSGKVVFPWKVLRTFLRPPLSLSASPAADDLQVELSLKVLAPLFFAQHKPAGPQRKVAIAEDIPDVFGAKLMPGGRAPAPAAPAPAVAPVPSVIPMPAMGRPAAPTPAPTAAAPAVATPRPTAAPAPAPAPAPVPTDIGEVLGQPGRKQWPPAEVVQRTAQLPGVAGALMALQDGLLIAGHLPPGINGETVSAFLPQMYSRMTQYCKELKFGEPRKMTFIVENVPLKVYKGAGIYFTILGRAGEGLPDAHLDVIAAHLSSQANQ